MPLPYIACFGLSRRQSVISTSSDWPTRVTNRPSLAEAKRPAARPANPLSGRCCRGPFPALSQLAAIVDPSPSLLASLLLPSRASSIPVDTSHYQFKPGPVSSACIPLCSFAQCSPAGSGLSFAPVRCSLASSVLRQIEPIWPPLITTMADPGCNEKRRRTACWKCKGSSLHLLSRPKAPLCRTRGPATHLVLTPTGVNDQQ
jgi:hypothetical protein